jgi:hypothetical protein
MDTVRIFMSFDPLHDDDLKARLFGEAAMSASGFEIAGCSEAAELTEAWNARVRRRIEAVDEVIIICGVHTRDSMQTATEIGIAQQQQKPYFLLWGRRELMCTKPVGAKPNEGMYSWTTPILRDQIALTLRRNLEPPEHLKRAEAGPRYGAAAGSGLPNTSVLSSRSATSKSRIP